LIKEDGDGHRTEQPWIAVHMRAAQQPMTPNRSE